MTAEDSGGAEDSKVREMVRRINAELSRNPSAGLVLFDQYAIRYNLRNCDKPLVFTFDNFLSAGPSISTRAGWGMGFLTKNGYNCVSFLAARKNWYRTSEFREILEAFITSEFDGTLFPRRIAYGSSMGAYAAAAFGDVLGCEERVLFHPVSTLNQAAVPWESRKFTRNRFDWNGPYWDSVEGCPGARRVTILVDNLFHLDWRHAKRFEKNENTRILKCTGLGHGIPLHLKALGNLNEVVLGLLEGTLSDARFYAMMRGRRTLKRYFDWLSGEQNRHLTDYRRKVIRRWRLRMIEPAEYRVPVGLVLALDGFSVARRRAVYRMYRATFGRLFKTNGNQPQAG